MVSYRLILPAIAATLILSLCALLYAWGISNGKASCQEDMMAQIDEWQRKANAASARYDALSKEKRKQQDAIKRKESELSYAHTNLPECRTPDEWMRHFHENASAANSR